ncbi:hypothetical protein PVAND_010154 [Polypedilum vanderplanki]|uniref:PDZ domain-containing protein n=1 Tax=Polypedilum vanderplanki TaxID=319348 RepID=A0A9J6CEZ9_POLVA|nr:hypothetical protein PVAND_010154 [Polypedilum vanderplanki]
MQAHRRKKKKRPVFSYMRNIRSVFLQADDEGKFGFTLSGQQPCILSSIVKNSPADNANVKSGDFLISVNGKSVWHKSHEEIVELIGTSEYRIRITIADNYFSDSSDEEDVSQFRYRPKYPYSKSRSNRTQASTSNFDSPHYSRIPPRFHTHPPLPYVQHNISNLRNEYDISVENAVLKNVSSSTSACATNAVAGTSSSIMNPNTTVSIIVGYLGTIEIPKQIATSSKLQTVRSCIRKMRQEKRSPTLVLMNILPNSLKLLNSNNVILATYPANRLNYISSSSDNSSKFFGLVTSAKLQHDNDDGPFDSYDSLKIRQVEVAITNSCHVFGIETKLIDHNAHLATADKFKIKCTKDLISNSCLEFPTTSDYICNIIRSMYNIKSPEKVETSGSIGMKFNQIQRRNNQFNDPHELLLPNSPHPSNHSEITTSSNSDSGIGFHNDLTNISDRILVVDFPDQNHCALGIHNKNLNLQRQRKSRPLGIVNDLQLQENVIRNIRTMHQQSSSSTSPSLRVENIYHAKSKSADYNYENVEKLAIRAMPLRNVSNIQQSLENDYENIHPKAVTDVWYDGEMLDEDGNEIHERAIDVSLEKQSIDQGQKIIMIRSCDDILMIMDSEDARYCIDENQENKPIEQQTKKDDHIFLVPSVRPQKKSNNNNKRSLTLLGKNKSSHEDSKSKHESNLKHYKLSPKVFGLARPVSISFENLSTSSSTKRRSLFGSKKKESKNVDDEEFSIWGSLQELRNCENLKQEKQTNFLEGTYSEPNLSYDELEFRSLEPTSFKLNASIHEAIKENSYSEVIKAFMQKIHDRKIAKSRDETKNFSKLASSTPFKKCELRNSFNISGIAHLDSTIRKKIDCSHNSEGLSLNDSDFVSMDQDQYDDTKENVNINNISVERNASVNEIIKCMQLSSASKDKKLRGLSEKFKRHSSPYKSGRKNCKSIKVTKEISQAYLKSENQSLASIITTESIKEIENYPLKSQTTANSEIIELDIKNESIDFAFTHPNKTQSFEASIKNLTQLSVSIF